MAKVELLSSATHLFVLDTQTKEVSIRQNNIDVTIKIPCTDYLRTFIVLMSFYERRLLEEVPDGTPAEVNTPG